MESPKPSRRGVLVLASAPLLAQIYDPVPKSFRVAIPQATIARIAARIRGARFPERIDSTDWSYGVDWDYMKSLSQVLHHEIRLAQGGSWPESLSAIRDPS
jgi:hypothetical protein